MDQNDRFQLVQICNLWIRMIGSSRFPSATGTISSCPVVVVVKLWGEAASAETIMFGVPGSYCVIALYWVFLEL